MMRRHAGARIFGSEQLDAGLRIGLIGQWIGGEGSGTGWRDQSGYQNHGTFLGAPKWALSAGYERYAIRTAAGSDQIRCGTAGIATNLTSLSITAWIYTTSMSAEQQIVSKLTSTASAGWVFVIDAGGTLTWFAVSTGTSPTFTTTAALVTNTWYHVAYRQSQMVGGTGDIFINGVQQALSVSGGGTGIYNTDATANLAIAGRDFDSSGLVGMVDAVSLYNRTLSPAEIAMIAMPSYRPVLAVGRRHRRLTTTTAARPWIYYARQRSV